MSEAKRLLKNPRVERMGVLTNRYSNPAGFETALLADLSETRGGRHPRYKLHKAAHIGPRSQTRTIGMIRRNDRSRFELV